jgi:cell division protein FtsW (lipid II flippase)/cell division protein FtsI/penicillin-binding protein 2
MQSIPASTQTEIARRERFLLLLAAAFVAAGAITLHLTYPPFGIRHLSYVIFSYVISFAAAHVTLSRRLPGRDPLLLPTAAILSGWGLLMVGRLAPNFLSRQVTWLLLSTLGMLGVVQTGHSPVGGVLQGPPSLRGAYAPTGHNLRWLQRYRYTWLLAGLALLAATLVLGVNPSGYGPRLWLELGQAYFQPSEPLKLLLVVYLASYLAERGELLVSEGRKLGRWRLPSLAYAGPLLAMFGMTALLLAGQQDLGTAMLFFFTFLGMLYLATGEWVYVVAGSILFLLAGAVGYASSTRLALRVDGWLNPWPNAADQSFQIVQSLLAFGAGGILGQGIGLGRSIYIPAVHTDFVFAAIGEAFGLAGTLVVIALYGILLLRGLRIAACAPRPFERLLAAGLTSGLVIQAWVIMAANVKLAPIAGVTLPFLSYGGSSLLSTFIALGLLLRVSSSHTYGRSVVTPTGGQKAVVKFRLLVTRLACVLGLGLALVAAVCGYWSVARAEWLAVREDNPRRVEYEQRIVRGQILDRTGVILADVEAASSGIVTRTYPVTAAVPVVGYASLRYGTSGIEAAFDEHLRGEESRSEWEAVVANLLHRPPQGQDVQLTLDADLQQLAQQNLAGKTGAAILLDAQTGEILALASAPAFDPARLDEEWDQLREDPAAPLINRATQGLYQPGAVLQTIVVAEALAKDLTGDLEHPAPNATRSLAVNGVRLSCSTVPAEPYTLASAYAAACPAPIAALGEQLGADGLAEAVERWMLTTSPPLEIPTEATDWDGESLSTTTALRMEAIGQGKLTVSPLQMALVAGTLANEGTMPAPRLVLRVQDAEGRWQEYSSTSEPQSLLSPSDARELLAAWQRYENDPSTVSEGASASPEAALRTSIAAHWGVAVAGKGAPHAWFIGVTPMAGDTRYAVAVLIEHAADAETAITIGAMLLQSASQ